MVRAIMLEAAAVGGQDPMVLGFVHALRVLLAFAPVLAMAPPWELPILYDVMLRDIAAQHTRRGVSSTPCCTSDVNSPGGRP